MEFVYGPTLEELITYFQVAGVPVPLPLAVDLIRQAANGLAAAHERGITNRDVKPGNMLLELVIDAKTNSVSWRLRVCDFGLAVTEDQTKITAAGMRPCTRGYLAPELIENPSRVADSRSDAWALGVIFCEMVTGQYPFSAITWEQMRYQITTAAIKPREANPDIPEGIEALILRLLDRSETVRPTMAYVRTILETFDGSDIRFPSEPVEGKVDSGGRLHTGAAYVAPADEVGGQKTHTLVHTKGRQRFLARLPLFTIILLGGVALWVGVGSSPLIRTESHPLDTRPNDKPTEELTGRPGAPIDGPISDQTLAARVPGADTSGSNVDNNSKAGKGPVKEGDRVILKSQVQGFANPARSPSGQVPVVQPGTVGTVIKVDTVSHLTKIQLVGPSMGVVWVYSNEVEAIKE